MPLYNAASAVVLQSEGDSMASAEEIFSRRYAVSTGIALTSQLLRLTYFTCRRTETTTTVRMSCGSTAAGATPTLARIGLYTIAANGDGTLVASTANDTALFAATGTTYTKSWSVAYAKSVGQRLALGVLVVTAATAPQLSGIGGSTMGTENAVLPRVAAQLSGQADLPSSFTDASLAVSGNAVFGVVAP